MPINVLTFQLRHRFAFRVLGLLCLFGAIAGVSSAQDAEPNREHLEFFESKVRPLLVENCYACHSLAEQENQGGLLLDSRAAILAGGDSGEAIVPGEPDDSLLMGAVRYEDYEMPPKGQLPEKEIAILEKWIKLGAPWPAADKANGPALETFDLEARRKEHWMWQPVNKQATPEVTGERWSERPIDRFVYAKLKEKQIQPAEQADSLAIARRLHMDLTGLPPTLEALATFEADLQQGRDLAIEKLADQLLASKHFGERWGRHWLDLVRYAESRGHEFDTDTPNAFQYRDYVIRAFNADVPYDQFVREHIAGDLIDEPRMHPEKQFNESVLGTGFWFLGEATHSPVDILKDESDRFDNMIDVASKSFLGATVSCARCHDHKFDAISTADYYSLTGFLHSSDYRQVRFESIVQNGKLADKLAQIDRNFETRISKLLTDSGLELPAKPEPLSHEQIVINYSDSQQTDLLQEGYIFGKRTIQAGSVYFSMDDEGAKALRIATRGAAVNDPFWNGLQGITQGTSHDKNKLAALPQSGRTLRTPTFELSDGRLRCLVLGTGHIVACVDSHRQLFGPLHGETLVKFDSADPKWVSMKLDRYVGHRLHLEFVPATKKQIAVRLVTQGGDKESDKQLADKLARADKAFQDYAEKAEELLGESAFVSETKESNASIALADVIGRWKKRRQQLAKQIVAKSRLAPAMSDGVGEDAKIYIRGNSAKPGKTEARHFLSAITGDEAMEITGGSGRLELAALINDPSNPLTSRVIVNRIWHYLLGRGIVPTTDDFGVLGQRPTHPELLDFLATEFIADGQSIKRMIKRIVLTETYQMASQSNAESVAADPKNLLWHHRPPKRLEGEIIRDSLLAISGQLDKTQFGPSIPVHLTTFMEGRGRPKVNGPLDGDRRRSIYVAVRRNFLSPFMLTFDTPAPFSTMGRRTVSNVPAQALILMNDPFVAGQAKAWAQRCLDTETQPKERIEWMYQSAFARVPTESELEISLGFVEGGDELETWTHFAHALINTKEFIFLR